MMFEKLLGLRMQPLQPCVLSPCLNDDLVNASDKWFACCLYVGETETMARTSQIEEERSKIWKTEWALISDNLDWFEDWWAEGV